MKSMILYFGLIFLYLKKIVCDNEIYISAIALAGDNNVSIQTNVDKFNKYSKENNLNIKLKLNILTSTNSSLNINNFGSMVESLLKKQKNKYDIYFYDYTQTSDIGSYLLDLTKWIPNKYFESFNINFIMNSCTYKDKLVGLPGLLGYSLLYSNVKLLKKYDKSIPKTWNELLETSKYILKRENNTNLIAYNGLFNEVSEGICSIYEFIYSCRDSIDSPFPDLQSEVAIKSLEMIKQIKNEIASDYIFSNNLEYGVNKMFEDNALFIKCWKIHESVMDLIPSYKVSPLPGIKEDISGSVVVGYNIGIDKNIKEEKKIAAIRAVKYISFTEINNQCDFYNKIMNEKISIVSNDGFNIMECNFLKSLHLIGKPTSKFESSSEYEKRFINYAYDFLYRNKSSAYEALRKIDNLTRIYSISINNKESDIGFIYLIVASLVLILMPLSLIVLYIKKFEPYYMFLPKDFWIISIIGIMIFLSSAYTNFGPRSAFKCYLFMSLLILGFTLNLTPFFYKLIINFPENNKISRWVYGHRHQYILFLVLIDLILISLYSIKKYDIENVFKYEGENFQKCVMNDAFGLLIISIIALYKLIIIITMLILIFIEWNIELILYDVRFIVTTIYIDIIFILILVILCFLDISTYKTYFIIHGFTILFISITNFILLYGFRIIMPSFKKEEEIKLYINTIHNLRHKMNGSTYSSNIISNSNDLGTKNTKISYANNGITERDFSDDGLRRNSNYKSTLFSKILDYHFKTSSMDFSENNSEV